MTVVLPPARTLDEVIAGSHRTLTRAVIVAGPATGETLPVTDGGVSVTTTLTTDALNTCELVDVVPVSQLPSARAAAQAAERPAAPAAARQDTISSRIAGRNSYGPMR